MKLGSVGITTCSDIEFEFEPSSLIRKRDGGPKDNEGMFVDVDPSKLLDAIAGTRKSKFDCKSLLFTVDSNKFPRLGFEIRSDD